MTPQSSPAARAVLVASVVIAVVFAGALPAAGEPAPITISVPEEVPAGQPVDVEVTVWIPDVQDVDGCAEGTINLSVDGRQVASRTATVSDGENRTVTFQYTFEEPGAYIVEVSATTDAFGGYSASNFTTVAVTNTTAPTAPTETLPGGTGPPIDHDGDGKYEDVTGDGEFDIVDVAVLLDVLDLSTVADHPEWYDFTGEGDVNVRDVAELLARTW
jgi:PKD repeat protein